MKMTTESGRVVKNVREAEVQAAIESEEFVILAINDLTYIQCAERKVPDPSYDYILEYQDGTVDRHFRATDESIPIERVRDAFMKYLRGDPSWQIDFAWEHMNF
jgi:hypothetical protein